MRSCNATKHLLFSSLFTLYIAGVPAAANFELYKSIEVGATTTDNLTLVNSDAVNEEALVFNIKPSVEFKYSGNRFGVAAVGEVEYYRFNEREEDIVDPRLFMRIRGTLVDDLFFLDSSLAISKVSTDNAFLRPFEEGEAVATSDTKVYLERSFGRTAELYTGYKVSTLAQRSDDELEVTKHTVDFELERNPRYGGLLWGFGGLYSQDESNINQFKESYLYGKLGGSVSKTLLTEFTYGIENRELINTVDGAVPIATEFENSALWNAQLNWSPTELTTFIVGYGERFFGSGPNMQLRHRTRNSSTTASYTRNITRQIASLDSIATLGENTNPTITDTDIVNINNINNQALLEEPFVDNRFQLTYKLAGRRSDIVVDAVYSDQEPLAGRDTIQRLLGRLVFDRRLSNFLTLRFQYDYQKSEARNRATFNYIENRFGIKFIYYFDGNDQFRNDETAIE